MLLRCIRLERSQCDQRYSTGAGQKESNGLEAFKGVEEVLAETKDVRRWLAPSRRKLGWPTS